MIYLSAPEVHRELQISPNSLYKLCEIAGVTPLRHKTRRFFTPEQVEQLKQAKTDRMGTAAPNAVERRREVQNRINTERYAEKRLRETLITKRFLRGRS